MSSCSHFARPEGLRVRKSGDKGIRRLRGEGKGLCVCRAVCVCRAETLGEGLTDVCVMSHVCVTSLPCLRGLSSWHLWVRDRVVRGWAMRLLGPGWGGECGQGCPLRCVCVEVA